MCGRYTLINPVQALAQLEIPFPSPLPERFNIAPTQPVVAVRRGGVSPNREAVLFQWGLVPSWANDPSIGSRLINARGETVTEKPAFRTAFKRRRCLLPADGFYEWRKEGATRQPYHFHRKDGSPFAFAGLWETWERAEGYLETCTILTTTANEVMAPIHDRMPVILAPDDYEEWLDPANQNTGRLLPLIQPYPSDLMEASPVSTRVNNAASEGPDLLAPQPQTSLFPNSF
jgi:putative SOS response-associated peptidase YedK